MPVACPYCKAVLNPKGLKPGQFKPRCPGCAGAFVLIVGEDQGLTAKPLPNQGKPSAPVSAPPAKTPATVPGGGDPNATGNFTEAAQFDTNRTGNFTEPDANRTGDFTSPAANRTGNFTQPPTSDANRTGDFTDGGNPNATGDFTEASPNATADFRPDRGEKTDAFDDPAQVKPKKKAAKGEDPIPEKLGGYEVMRILGKGGMGAVLLGRQVSLDRKVALKIMHARLAKDPGFVARFTREAYAAAQLTHHNVVQIYDIGEDRGTHFFSMEFVNGKSLMEVVKKEGKLDAEVAVGYILQAARGLRYGHNQGMVHRDIKPDNLMLNNDGIVKVADLGLVKLPTPDVAATTPASEFLDDDDPGDGDTQRLTRAGSVMGTPAYMPPEQARDSASVDQRADIYSLGCSLYVMITGKPPYEGKTALEVISKHQTEPLVPPEAIVKRVPKALSGILIKMLAKKPEDRYQNMDEVIAALEGFLGMSKGGPITPKEEQADTLEKASNSFAAASKGGFKKLLSLGFFGACVLAIIVCGALGKFAVAGGFVGLLVMTPLAYFVLHGTMTKSYLWSKVREWLGGSRIVDYLMWAGGAVLFLLTLYIFGWLWFWLGFCVLAVGLAYAMFFLTDQAEQKKQEEPLSEAKSLFKSMRLQGLEEESLRQFACKYSGDNWEAFYESLFGYEAKQEARAYRKGAVTEGAGKKHAAWREPVIGWIDAKSRQRKEDAERKHLLKVQSKALEAKGVSAAEAKEQAEELAGVMVGAASEARTAVRSGKKADIKAMVAVARARKRPPAGYNIAGIPLRKGPSMKDRLNSLLGRRFRLILGAGVFALGMLWLHQTDQLKQVSSAVEKAGEKVAAGDTKGLEKVGTDLGKVSSPLTGKKGLEFLPDAVAEPFRSYASPIAGFLMIFAGLFYYGWKPTLVAVPGLVIALFGSSLGIPEVGPLPAWALSTLIGGFLIVVVGRFLRG